MNVVARRRVTPIAVPGRGPGAVFAMAGETDISALMQNIEAANKETVGSIRNLKESVAKIMTDLEEQAGAISAMKAGSATDNGGRQSVGNIRAELGALGVFARKGDETKLREISASMSVGSDPDGGYYVTPALSSTMTKKLFDTTVMRRLSRVETITAGDAWEEPLDYGDAEAQWVGETQDRPATQTPKIGKLRVPVPEMYALQPITQRLLDDVGFDLGGWLEGKVTDKFARTEGQSFISGDGVNKPQGFLSVPIVATKDATRPWGSLQYVPSGNSSGFPASDPADVLKDLTWSLRAPYRSGANFIMNSNTAAVVDKFKDSTGNYLWQRSIQLGVPPTLLSYPVEIDETMPDIGANAMPIAFGNFKLGYVIVDKIGIRLLRDPFTSKPNVLFYFYKRVGGGVDNSEAIKLLKIATS